MDKHANFPSFPSFPSWRWSDVCQALEITDPKPGAAETFPGAHIDSREIAPGQLFFALAGDPGARFNVSQRSSRDGHDFVAQAAQAGAGGAVVSRLLDPVGLPGDFRLLLVNDTYDALWRLGQAAAQRVATKVAVTGSSGKTTAKSFLQAALGSYASPGSFNNHIGVPLSLINCPITSLPAVFEIGTNHAGEIEPLTQLVSPDVALVLNVGTAHLENFVDKEALKKEKLSIFNGLNDLSKAISHDAISYVHGFQFGRSDSAHAQLESLQDNVATIRLFDKTLTATVPGGGWARAETLTATVLTLRVLELDIEPALALGPEALPKGRGNLIATGQYRIIDESYNANPTSMLGALESFCTGFKGDKTVVLGEMLELGDQSPGFHLEILGRACQLVPKEAVFCVGVGFEQACLNHGVQWFASVDDALLESVGEFAINAPNIFVKGSNRVFWAKDFVSDLEARLDA